MIIRLLVKWSGILLLFRSLVKYNRYIRDTLAIAWIFFFMLPFRALVKSSTYFVLLFRLPVFLFNYFLVGLPVACEIVCNFFCCSSVYISLNREFVIGLLSLSRKTLKKIYLLSYIFKCSFQPLCWKYIINNAIYEERDKISVFFIIAGYNQLLWTFLFTYNR